MMLTATIAALLAAAIFFLLAATRSALKNWMVPVTNIALSTLGSKTALSLGSTMAAITTPLLMKRIRYFLMLHSVTTDEGPFIVGLASGNASAAEISAAISEANTAGPEDVTQSLSEDNAWVVMWNTVEFLQPADSGGEYHSKGEWHSLGKGMPAQEAVGFQAFIANLDGTALTTGAEVQGSIQVQGVWLRG